MNTDNKRHIIIIYTLGLLSALYMIFVVGPKIAGDTVTYVDAWQSLCDGTIDIMRTPVYPAIIGLAKAIGGESHWMIIVILLQHLTALTALWYFYKIARRTTRSETAAFLTTAALACLPFFTSQHNFIMTESLSLSGSIFLVSCAINIYGRPSGWSIGGFALWLLFLVFLRPSFIYLLPVTAVAFIIMWWQKHRQWKTAAIGLVAIVAVSAAAVGYMAKFKSTYGVFTSSMVSVENDFYIMRQNGTLDPGKTANKALGNYIASSYEKDGRVIYGPENYGKAYGATEYAFNHFSLKDISQAVDDSKTLSGQIKGIVFRTYYAGLDMVLGTSMSTPFNDLNITMGWIYLLLLFYLLHLVGEFRRTGHLPWASTLLFLLGTGNLAVAVAGASIWADGEWGRLVYPSKFIYLTMLAQLLVVFAENARKGRHTGPLYRIGGNKKQNLLIIYALGTVSALLTLIVFGPVDGGDTLSYLDSWNHFSNGLIDNDRLPAYACVVGLAKAIGGAAGEKLVLAIIQNIVGLVALRLFYSVAGRATHSERAAFWSTLVIALLPFYASWHNCIITESFSMSGLIFITYYATALYDGRSRWNLLGFGFWLLFLIFLKPSLAYLLPVSLVAFGIMLWRKRRLRLNACGGILVVVAVTGAMLAYMSAYKDVYGVFASSRVGSLNAYFNMRNNCTLDPSKASDKSLAKYITDSYDKYGRTPFSLSDSLLWEDSYYPYEHWKFTAYYEVVSKSMKENLPMQARGAARRLYYSGQALYLKPMVSTPLYIFNFTMGWIYLLVVVLGLWVIYEWRRRGTLPWLPFLLLMLGASQIIVNIIGAQDDWARLICPANAIYVIISALLIVKLFFNKASRRLTR